MRVCAPLLVSDYILIATVNEFSPSFDYWEVACSTVHLGMFMEEGTDH